MRKKTQFKSRKSRLDADEVVSAPRREQTRDFNREIQNFLEYGNNPWAYYHVYPEYFKPVAYPMATNPDAKVSVISENKNFLVDSSGKFCIVYRPGNFEDGVYKPLIHFDGNSLTTNGWTIPPTSKAHKSETYNATGTVSGGYLNVWPTIAYGSGVLSFTALDRMQHDRLENIDLQQAQLRSADVQEVICRYILPTGDPLRVQNQIIYLVVGSGFLPNTIIQYEMRDSLMMNNTLYNVSQNIIEAGQESETATAKVKWLLRNRPRELLTTPLLNPLAFPLGTIFAGEFKKTGYFHAKMPHHANVLQNPRSLVNGQLMFSPFMGTTNCLPCPTQPVTLTPDTKPAQNTTEATAGENKEKTDNDQSNKEKPATVQGSLATTSAPQKEK